MSTDEKTIVSVIGTESVLSGDLHVDYNNQDYSHNKNTSGVFSRRLENGYEGTTMKIEILKLELMKFCILFISSRSRDFTSAISKGNRFCSQRNIYQLTRYKC
jgi:hypothetical protein